MSKAQKARENLQKAEVKENAAFDRARIHNLQQDELLEARIRDNDPYGQLKPYHDSRWGSHEMDQQIEHLTGIPQRPFYRWFKDPVGVFSQYAFMWLFMAIATVAYFLQSLFE